jgi:CheY-like chemotaxis protein
MTANVMEGDEQRCLDAGMDDYLGKPIDVQKVRNVLDKWRKRAGKINNENAVKSEAY